MPAHYHFRALLLTCLLLCAVTLPSIPTTAAPPPAIAALFPGTPGSSTSTAFSRCSPPSKVYPMQSSAIQRAIFTWLDAESVKPSDFFAHFHEEHESDMRAWLARGAQQ